MIRFKIEAKDLKELHAILEGLSGQATLANADTDILLDEVRQRLRMQGLGVDVVALKNEGAEAVGAAPAPKRGRPAKSNPTTAVQPTAADTVPEKLDGTLSSEPVTNTTDAGAVSEQNSTAEEKKSEGPLEHSATAGAATTPTTATEAAPAPTRDEVIAYLNTYAASRGGQVAGRTKMQEVCGTNRLQDIKPEDYPKLIAALKAAA